MGAVGDRDPGDGLAGNLTDEKPEGDQTERHAQQPRDDIAHQILLHSPLQETARDRILIIGSMARGSHTRPSATVRPAQTAAPNTKQVNSDSSVYVDDFLERRQMMAGKNTAVFGIYPTTELLEQGTQALKAAGFRNTDISVLFSENQGTKDFAHEKGTKAPEGASAGAGTGAVVGGALGWLLGIGALTIPGVGPFIAAGPIMVALAGVGVGGAVGGLTGALVGMGIPEYEAKRYEGRVLKGGMLLSVHSDNSEWTTRAKTILEQTGAQDISSTGETKGDFQNTDRPTLRPAAR